MPDATPTLILTARITAAWLASHPFETADVPSLITDVHRALTGCLTPATEAPDREAPRMRASEPAVPILQSVFPSHLICLECGAKMRTLRKHLRRTHGIEPEAYRARWGLPGSYPMVAPEYAEIRSGMAKAAGLGRKR